MSADDRADVHIREPISNSLNQWDAMATDLAAAWPAIAARIRALNAASPQGGGADGVSFSSSYLAGGGPERFLRDTEELVKEISGSGPLLRATVSNTLTTEQAIDLGLTNAYRRA
ncbi:hypothetical protein DMB42_07540 [Nonomuraea sp. WAC 01424]|uniref:hypothetical protein n=1 Tax=Nonomuraea sp. WAC 01424 TaxID=2203200 RepID=UPI000F767C92|nr:hypothetical protein [Nonomuraea sp. WAC 01424]RSN14360.1 hypothetical protein DMB42_07540 [Nonomuraea sp. WAC 01424]